MTSPILSLCIPTYNRANRLVDLLSSIAREIAGIPGAVEVVISDNCSSDETAEVVEAFQPTLEIAYSRRERNIGIAANICLVPSLATGRFCWILGDDDMLVPGAIAEVLRLIAENSTIPAIVTGYSYQQESGRDRLRDDGATIEFERPIFRDLRSPEIIPRWEDTFFETGSPALHTSIVSCVFLRSAWMDHWHDFDDLAQQEPLTSLDATFPHTLIWASFLIGKPVVFAPQPLVFFFVGNQEWFAPKWTTILFSFALELARRFRAMGADEQAVQYYESLILRHPSLERMLDDDGDYARKYFSLSALLRCYCDRSALQINLARILARKPLLVAMKLYFRLLAGALRSRHCWYGSSCVVFRDAVNRIIGKRS